MEKQADGFWTVTTTPLVPGLHYYQINIDGAEVSDPGSHAFYGGSRHASAVEIPEPGVDFYSIKDVPHRPGARSLVPLIGDGIMAPCAGLSTAGIRCEYEGAYPVLYLQHGGGEDETGWIRQGARTSSSTTCIAAKDCKPMIVVMAYGYARRAGQPVPTSTPGPSPEAARAAKRWRRPSRTT
jgi:enterochelin esterase family protein